jgi:hypothetical protein
MTTSLRSILVLLSVPGFIYCQTDTRGAILGHVTDSSSAAVAGAKVAVRNTLTNVLTELTTDASGYYEAPLILAGTYNVSVTAPGFKTASHPDFDLPAGARLEVNIKLEVGAVSDSVTVSAAPPLLNADNTSTGLVVDSQNVMDLPFPGGNAMILTWMAPGAQSTLTISDSSQGLHSGGPGNSVGVAGRVGGNDFYIDGASNNANNRGSGFNPAPEFVQAVRVETSGFDASFGHSTGMGISLMTNSGTNQYHGALREEHLQSQWAAADLFAKQAYYNRINTALGQGNTAQADAIRNSSIIQPGRRNAWAATVGGPVVLPKIFNGKDKLFFFFGYTGFNEQLYNQQIDAFPTAAMRQGDFSQLLNINATNYQIYDPYSTAADPTRSGHVVRTPFPGNIVPLSRIINPAYKWVANLLPLPNTLPSASNAQPNTDYTVYSAPYWDKYYAFINRYDYNVSSNDRFFFRWSHNQWTQSNALWYNFTTPNIGKNAGNVRTDSGAGLDWVHNFGARSLLDVALGFNSYQNLNVDPILSSLKPSDLGYPTYLDTKISGDPTLPSTSWSGWTGASLAAAPTVTNYRVLTVKADFSHMASAHTLKAGIDIRGQFFTGYTPGNTAGAYSYTSAYTQRTDDGAGSAGTGAYGGSWAAFMMGVPTSVSADANASAVLGNPYYATYVHDTWRVSSRLTVNIGLRLEYELGPTERYNRAIGTFDPTAQLPISAEAQAAYAKNPIAEVPASQFTVLGGGVFPGANGADRKIWNNSLDWLPRVAAAYELSSRTVIRLGYGLYADTLNVENETINQLGYSWPTSTTLTNDLGQTWLTGNLAAGISPMSDPFPVRSNGTRFDTPPGSSLGAMAPVGRGFTFVPYNRPHALENRWRLDVQRQIRTNFVLNVGYAGSYSDNIPINQSLSALPAQYMWFGNTRNDTIANNLNTNIANPFNIANFADIKTSNPALYQFMSGNSFFTSTTIHKSALLSPYPWMNGLTETVPLGKAKTEELDLNVQRRFAGGSNFSVSYTKLDNLAADYFPNPFDKSPAWEPSNTGRPHRLAAMGIAQLPFGNGHRFVNSGLASKIVGGFQLTGMAEYQPGQLIQFSSTSYFTGTDLSQVCDSGPHSIAEWFNTSLFVTNPTLTSNTGQARTFPNFISGYGGCRGDSQKRANASLQRQFKIKDRTTLVMRWDVYNITNHGQLGLPNTTPTAGGFGQITGSFANGSGVPTSNRSMRVSARILF